MRILRSGAFWIAAFGLVALIGCKSAEQKEADTKALKELEGTWVATSADADAKDAKDEDGGEAPELKGGTTYVIEGDVLKYNSGGETYFRQKISLDASKDPKTIELLEIDEKGNRVTTSSSSRTVKKAKAKTTTTTTEFKQLGVYKIDGDTLTMTLGVVNNKSRPTAVGTKRSGAYTLVLKKKGGKAEDKKEEKEGKKKEEEKEGKKKEDKKEEKEGKKEEK